MHQKTRPLDAMVDVRSNRRERAQALTRHHNGISFSQLWPIGNALFIGMQWRAR
jgi:hypothetical protein